MGVRGGESIDGEYDGDGRANASQGSADGRSMIIAVAMAKAHTARAADKSQSELRSNKAGFAPEANPTPRIAMRPFQLDENHAQQYAIRLQSLSISFATRLDDGGDGG